MALKIPVFNNAETDRGKLHPQNGGMGELLSVHGNTIRVLVSPLRTRGSSFGVAGADWTAWRVSGLQPRRVVWYWRIRCDSQANLNAVELRIDQYIAAGTDYILTDGKGRTGDNAILLGEDGGTRRLGPRLTLPGGHEVQRWQLVFEVLTPQAVEGKL